jgi:hypothetical protein
VGICYLSYMRFGLCVIAFASLATVAGCPQGDDGYDTYYPPGDGPPPDACKVDSDCGSDVCARDGECLPADEVQHVVVTWTVEGSAASDATCTSEPNLELSFDAGNDSGYGVGFAPVPCNEGKFNVDKMPSAFTDVTISLESGAEQQSAPLDATGAVSFDLQ